MYLFILASFYPQISPCPQEGWVLSLSLLHVLCHWVSYSLSPRSPTYLLRFKSTRHTHQSCQCQLYSHIHNTHFFPFQARSVLTSLSLQLPSTPPLYKTYQHWRQKSLQPTTIFFILYVLDLNEPGSSWK